VNCVARVISVDAEDSELLLGGEQVSLGIVFAVLRGFLLRFGDSALVQEQVVAFEGDGGEVLVVDGLEIAIEGGGDVRALDVHDELALTDGIAELDMKGDDAAIGEGEDREFAGDVGVDRAGDLEGAADGLGGSLDEGKAAGTVDVHEVRAAGFYYLGGGRSFRGLGSGVRLATGEAECEEEKGCGQAKRAGGTAS
jgi:hypothetical protein